MKYNEHNFEAPEFVIALVGAVGSELQEVERICPNVFKLPIMKLIKLKFLKRLFAD